MGSTKGPRQYSSRLHGEQMSMSSRDGGSGKAEMRIPTSFPPSSACPHRFDIVPVPCQYSQEKERMKKKLREAMAYGITP